MQLSDADVLYIIYLLPPVLGTLALLAEDAAPSKCSLVCKYTKYTKQASQPLTPKLEILFCSRSVKIAFS